MLTVVRPGDGLPTARSQGPYTGELWRDLLQQDDDGNAYGKVFSTPCSRTFWHSHPGGQLLIIEHGEGLVGHDGGVVRVKAGDMIWTPPNIRHWHGATQQRSMMHVTVTFGGVEWQEELPDAEYALADSQG